MTAAASGRDVVRRAEINAVPRGDQRGRDGDGLRRLFFDRPFQGVDVHSFAIDDDRWFDLRCLHVPRGEFLSFGADERVVRQRHEIGERTKRCAAREIEGRSAIEKEVANRSDFGTAPFLCIVRENVVHELPRTAIVTGGDRPASGDQQFVSHNNERTLRSDAREAVGIVRLLHVRGAVAIVRPDDRSRAGVERMNEDSHERPDTGGEVHRAVGDDRRSARGPR